MPTVPNLEAPQVQAEALPGRANPRIDDNASAASFGAPLAQGLESVGAAGSEEQATLKRQNDQLRVIDANTQLEAGKSALLYGSPGPDGKQTGGAFALHGTDAMDMPNRITPQYDQLASSLAAKLTPDQQRLFQEHVANGKNALNTELNRYEYEESNRLAAQVYSNGAKQTISNATVGWRDPQTIQKSRLDLAGLVQMQGDREGWNKDERAQQLNKLSAEMHFNVVDRMLADGQAQSALGYFKTVRDTGELTGEQSHQLGSQIDAALQQHTAQNQTELLARINDVRTAASNGQAIPPSSMPSHGQILAAFPQDGERRWQAIQGDIQMGSDLKGMSGLSTSDIQARVESYKPASVAGAAEQYERYNTVGRAAQQILTARAADPRQFTIDNKLGASPLNFGDTQSLTTELRSRIATTAQDSARMGGYVPPLSRSEAAQFSSSLQTMTPADRLRTLAALNQGLGDDRAYQTVMHQVMPGSPVTAIVGSQVGQVKPSNTPVWFDRRYVSDPTDQTKILAGEQLLNPQGQEKTGEKGRAFNMPKEDSPGSGLRAQFSIASGDLFRNRPDLSDAYYAAFKGAYAQLLAEKGDTSGNGDTTLQTKALKMALGNVTTFNNQKVVAPPGLDPTRFESVLTNAVNVRAKSMGLDPSQLQGYTVEEIGGLGSGRYQLVQGNALVTNPGGRGMFQVDIRNQYMPDRSQPTASDARRQAADQPPAPMTAATSVSGDPKVGRASAGEQTPVKPVAVANLSRGSGRSARSRPSQGDIETQ